MAPWGEHVNRRLLEMAKTRAKPATKLKPKPKPKTAAEEAEARIGDGTRLAANLNAFLDRMNTALSESTDHLSNFRVKEIKVALAVEAGLTVSLVGIGGGLKRTRTFEFTLEPDTKPTPKPK